MVFEMIYSKPGPRATPKEGGESDTSVAVFPLGIPIIAGLGLITVIIMHTSPNRPWLYSVSMLVPAIIIGLAITYLTLRCSSFILRFLGRIVIFVMEKIIGLVLSGYALQLIYNGLRELEIIGG